MIFASGIRGGGGGLFSGGLILGGGRLLSEFYGMFGSALCCSRQTT